MLLVGSLVEGAVLEVVTYDVGYSEGRTGTPGLPLEGGDIVGVAIVVGHNPYPGFPSYDGYLVSSVDIDLHVVGPGSLNFDGDKCKCGGAIFFTDLDSMTLEQPPVVNGDIPRMQGISLAGLGAGGCVIDRAYYRVDEAYAEVAVLDLTLYGLSEYSPYKTASGGPYPGGWVAMTEDDLGDLVVNLVPEPLTMGLLGFAGMAIWRRRRRGK